MSLVTFCGSFTSVLSPTKRETKQKKSRKLHFWTIFCCFFYILYLFSSFLEKIYNDWATRIREFPSNAVMQRRMSTAKKQINCCCWNPPNKEREHSSSSNDFVWLLLLLKFVVDIILSSAFPFSWGFLFLQRKMAARITEA